MCEHYQSNSPVGFRVVREKTGVVAHTAPSRTAMIFLLEGTLRVEGKRFPTFYVHANQMFPMPAGIENSVYFVEDSLVLILYFIESKFRFCHNIISDEMIKSAPKRTNWLFALDLSLIHI